MGDAHDIRSLHWDDVLNAIYDELFTPAFAHNELEPLEALRGGLESDPPQAFGLYTVDPSGSRIGRCIYYPYPEANALLLGYLAVVDGERSRGTGARLLEESRRAWFVSGEYDLVLAQLDDACVFPAANGIDPERRIRFYANRGGKLICGPYFAPSVRPGGERVYDMLFEGSPRALPYTRAGVSSRTVAALLRSQFTMEGDQGVSDNGDFHWLMEAYKEDVSVPLIPVADHRYLHASCVPSRRSR